MNALERELSYPLGDTLPPPGRAIDVAPGVRWLRMPLPFALDHINLWLLRDERAGEAGWSIVDCGVATDATRDAWNQVFETSLDAAPVQRLIVTHMHPDHMGNAQWLTQRWGVRLWISATDWNAARMASASTTGYGGDAAAAYMASHGLTDADSLEKVRRRRNYYASMVPEVPSQFRRLMHGDVLRVGRRDWACHAGYGHAPEHIALHCAESNTLISGDMVLPKISTNISVIDIEPEANPLPLFLNSLEAMRALPADTLVLPSHGRPFRGLHKRIDQLQVHHRERLTDVMNACATAPRSAAELLPVLFKRTLDLHQTTFAMGEAVAHVHALWYDGKLVREKGADGVFRFAVS